MRKSSLEASHSVPVGLDEALRVIREKAVALPFATLTLTIHEGRVTQLEVSEKCRFVA